MNVESSTIREIIVKSEAAYGSQDAFRFKVKRADETGKRGVQVESRTYTQLKNDTESFSAVYMSYSLPVPRVFRSHQRVLP